jgi:DNA polymerase alpha subunit A
MGARGKLLRNFKLTGRVVEYSQSSILQPSGPVCPACNHKMATPSLQTQLEVQIRTCIGRYYEGWTVCDDATCALRTRSMGVYGRRCVRPGCRGNAGFEYTDVELYNQLRYYAMLFDSEKVKKAAIGSVHFGAVPLLSMGATRLIPYLRGSQSSHGDQHGISENDEGNCSQVH